MTKAEEITLFRQFVESLPSDSYLASILAGVPEYVERMVQNDWAISLAETLEVATARAILAELEAGKQRERAERLEHGYQRLQEKVFQLTAQLHEAREQIAALRD